MYLGVRLRVGFSWEAVSLVAYCLLVASEGTTRDWSAALQEDSLARKSEARIPGTRFFRAQRKEAPNLGQSSPRDREHD